MTSIWNHGWHVYSLSSLLKPFERNKSTEKDLEDSFSRCFPGTGSLNDDGNYAKVSFVAQDASRKRKLGGEDKLETGENHLRIEVFLQEIKAAEVVFCFAESKRALPLQLSTNRETSAEVVSSFSFLLRRGSKECFDMISEWVQREWQCRISQQPLHMSSADLVLAASQWVAEFQKRKQEDVSGSSENNCCKTPLALVFDVPPALVNGDIDTLSIAVPPTALTQFCKRLSTHNQHASVLVGDHKNRSELPIVRGLQRFLQTTFSINVSSFPLSKFSCAVGSLSKGGKCRLEVSFENSVLHFLRELAQRRKSDWEGKRENSIKFKHDTSQEETVSLTFEDDSDV